VHRIERAERRAAGRVDLVERALARLPALSAASSAMNAASAVQPPCARGPGSERASMPLISALP
jgi:hypothetical protein